MVPVLGRAAAAELHHTNTLLLWKRVISHWLFALFQSCFRSGQLRCAACGPAGGPAFLLQNDHAEDGRGLELPAAQHSHFSEERGFQQGLSLTLLDLISSTPAAAIRSIRSVQQRRKAHHFHGSTNVHCIIFLLSLLDDSCFCCALLQRYQQLSTHTPTYSSFWAKAEGSLSLQRSHVKADPGCRACGQHRSLPNPAAAHSTR